MLLLLLALIRLLPPGLPLPLLLLLLLLLLLPPKAQSSACPPRSSGGSLGAPASRQGDSSLQGWEAGRGLGTVCMRAVQHPLTQIALCDPLRSVLCWPPAAPTWRPAAVNACRASLAPALQAVLLRWPLLLPSAFEWLFCLFPVQ